MKKRIWSLLLCLVLVFSCFTGCGKADKGSSIAPEEYAISKLNEYADKVTQALQSHSNTAVSTKTAEGIGMDISLSLAIGRQVASAYGFAGLENIGMFLGYNAKDAMQGIAEFSLNGNSILKTDVYVDKESVYVNLPKYSKDYLKLLSVEDILGMSLEEYTSQIAKSSEGMPTAEEALELWTRYSEKFISCFRHEAYEKKAEAGTGNYSFSGAKYVICADTKDLVAVTEELFKELEKYPSFGTENIELEALDEDGKVYCTYYEGKKGQYAWEISDSKNEKPAVVFISAEKGFCLYTYEDGEAKVCFYSEKDSDRKGKIILIDEEKEYTFNYDNLTKDTIDISGEIDSVGFTVSIEQKNNQFYADFSVNTYGIIISGKLESIKGRLNISASVDYQGINFGTLALELKERDYQDFTMPSNGVDQETWEAGLDKDALDSDFQQLIMDYPFLAPLLAE